MKKYLIVTILLTFSSLFASSTNFCLVTLPKSGSHLVARCLEEITGKEARFVKQAPQVEEWKDNPAFFLWTHVHQEKVFDELAYQHAKIVINVRDPRDISLYKVDQAILDNQPPFLRETPNGHLWLNFDYNQKLSALFYPEIWGTSTLKNEMDALKSRLYLFKQENVWITHFEKLVGPNGGGTYEDQIRAIRALALFIERPISIEKAKDIASRVFGETSRTGDIGRWKKVYNSENVSLMKEMFGDLLIFLNYERNNNWKLPS